ncbi:hypothetical protein ACFTTN_31815 [Streptomyces niveus]|uniref:hypothetical protein n=1 Tax=Streptomyces niveus TaxID=193462 RepID=UPI00363A4D5E
MSSSPSPAAKLSERVATALRHHDRRAAFLLGVATGEPVCSGRKLYLLADLLDISPAQLIKEYEMAGAPDDNSTQDALYDQALATASA